MSATKYTGYPNESIKDGRITIDHSGLQLTVRESHGQKYDSLPVQAIVKYLRSHSFQIRMRTEHLWWHGHMWELSFSSS